MSIATYRYKDFDGTELVGECQVRERLMKVTVEIQADNEEIESEALQRLQEAIALMNNIYGDRAYIGVEATE